MHEEQTQLKSKIEAVNKTLETGLLMTQFNQDAANAVWKVINNIAK